MKPGFKVIPVFAAALFAIFAHAQEVRLEGNATALLDGKCRAENTVRGRKDEAALAEALVKAKINALRSYSASSSIAVANSFAAKEAEILASVDDFLLNYDIRVMCREGTKNLRVSVEGVLNKSAWDRTIALDSIGATERSRMTAVFVARKLKSEIIFDEKRSSMTQEERVSESSQGASVGGDGSMTAYGEATTSAVVTTGGKTEKKADMREYMIFGNDDIDAAINQGISEQGYRVAPVTQIKGIPLERFREDFATGDVITPPTLNAAFEALAQLPVNVLLMVATLDVGGSTKTQNMTDLVTVSVNAQVYKFDGLFFETVASVGPSQMRGEGLNTIEAERNALTNSSKYAVQELTAQLREKQIY